MHADSATCQIQAVCSFGMHALSAPHPVMPASLMAREKLQELLGLPQIGASAGMLTPTVIVTIKQNTAQIAFILITYSERRSKTSKQTADYRNAIIGIYTQVQGFAGARQCLQAPQE